MSSTLPFNSSSELSLSFSQEVTSFGPCSTSLSFCNVWDLTLLLAIPEFTLLYLYGILLFFFFFWNIGYVLPCCFFQDARQCACVFFFLKIIARELYYEELLLTHTENSLTYITRIYAIFIMSRPLLSDSLRYMTAKAIPWGRTFRMSYVLASQ